MNIIDEANIHSTINIKESRVLKTALFKSVDWLYENKTYSLSFKVVKKISSSIPKFDDGDWSYEIKYKQGCKIGIKRIAQCTDEYENEEILAVTAEELLNTPYEGTLFTFNVYPFDGKE
ncbi:unnamed protein product [Macrosiphum euphorbiae]|uniref:Uncharacterized protein n=1 Tax=Macrosiphum euphorbiae TaxID=13131 RepID=A0AAV0W4F3_9HEMI|nr:unnamed protein product [Macrosiphum euphorbiae]